MTITADDLYELLPSVYRVRDAERGYPLKAMVGVLAGQADAIALDIEGLYANWFIETCQDWVVPYIGDLLRVRRINVAAAGMSERSYVANTLGYRRRKGTVSVIERLAYDVTGWRAKAVEMFQLLAITQNINHLRLRSVRTPDLRETSPLELLGGPFETATHSVEVRRIEPRRGRYNIPDVAVMLWRLQPYPVAAATARPVANPDDGRYTFSALGLDEPLFNPPKTETSIEHLAGEIDVPGPLRPRALHDDLLLLDPALRAYFAQDHRVLAVATLASPGGPPVTKSPDDISICDLSGWQRPSAGKVAVDVTRGRLALPVAEVQAGGAEVTYSFGFSADTGAGPYDRAASLLEWLDATPTWLVGVIQDKASRQSSPSPTQVFASLMDAIAAWNSVPGGNFGVICVMDSCTYRDALPAVTVPGGSRLAIVAAACDGLLTPGASMAVQPAGLMPVVSADITAVAASPAASKAAGAVVLDGLLVVGQVAVKAGDLGRLRISCSTLTDGITVVATEAGQPRNVRLHVDIKDSLSGPISVLGRIAGVTVSDSVVGRLGGMALDTTTSDLTVSTSTVFGTTTARTLNASDSIFVAPLQVERLQAGCVRFSYVPDGSKVPSAFRCQPALALARAPQSDAAAIQARLKPVFTSVQLGDPGYAQLSQFVATELVTGADNGSEMGAFNKVQQGRREANLRAALDEYLRFGLEAGTFYVN
jgi:hypothetical protein